MQTVRKKIIPVIAMLLCLLMTAIPVMAGDEIVEPQEQPEVQEAQGYNVSFVFEENSGIQGIDVYYREPNFDDMEDYGTPDETDAESTLARSPQTGEPDMYGDGQVLFRIKFDANYILDDIAITSETMPEGAAKDEENVSERSVLSDIYKIADIQSDIKVEIKAKEHVHVPGEAVQENVIPASCSVEGSHDEVVYCTECGAEMSRVSVTDLITEHTPGEPVQENVVPAGCAAGGSYENAIYCTSCGAELARETITTDPVPHVPGEAVIENQIPASEGVNESYDIVFYCVNCGAELSREHTEVQPQPMMLLGNNNENPVGEGEHVHTPGEAQNENFREADCINPPSHDSVVRCTECQEILSSEHIIDGEALGHDWHETARQEATCTEDGYVNSTCSRNETHTKTDILSAEGHKPGEPVEEDRVEPTCKAPGHYDSVIYCIREGCGAQISRTTVTIKKLPHQRGEVVIENEKPATCEKPASHDEVYYCTECSTELERTTKQTGQALGHKWNEGTVVKEPTCSTNGEKKITCTREGCDVSKTETIPATGKHTAGAPVKENEKPATCEENGTYESVTYCTGCHTEMSRTTEKGAPATGHSWDEGKVTKEPTCTAVGEKLFTCKNNASHTKTEEIPAKGHTWDASGQFCTVCGAQNPSFVPQLTAGNGQTYDVSKGGALAFTSNSNYVFFDGEKGNGKVLIDGKEIAPANYTVASENGTKVTLSESFLKSLAAGQHNITIMSANGQASGAFAITGVQPQTQPVTQPNGQPQTNPDGTPINNGKVAPKTGDPNNMVIWIIVAAVAVVAAASLGMVYINKKKKEKNK